MNQLINNRVGKPPKSKKRGCLFLVLGSLLAVLATGLYIVVVAFLTGVIIEARHGDESAYTLMTFVKSSYLIVLILFYAILALWYISPSQEEVDRQNQKFGMMGGNTNAKALSAKKLWLISGGIFLGVILCGAISINTYTLVSEDGVRTYFFAETSRYEWEDVSAYSIDCDGSEGLSITVTMRAGKQFEILQGINSATDTFGEKYENPTHFAAELDEWLKTPTDGHSVPIRRVYNADLAEKFYRDAYPDLWPDIQRLIGSGGQTVLLPDEIAPETESKPFLETESD